MAQLNLDLLKISGQEVFKMGLDDHKLVPLSEEDQKLVEEVDQTIFSDGPPYWNMSKSKHLHHCQYS